MLKNKKAIIGMGICLYIVIVAAGLLFLNRKRAEEYTYSYDLSFFNIDSGEYVGDGILIDDTNKGEAGVFANPLTGVLREGHYTVAVEYEATCDGGMQLSANSNLEKSFTLPSYETLFTYDFEVYPTSDKFRIAFTYPGEGMFKLKGVHILSDQPITTDYEYFMVLFALIAIITPIVLILFWKRLHFTKEQWIVVGVFVLTMIVLNYIIAGGTLWLGTDIRPHMMRTEGMRTAIAEHRFPSILYANYCNDYGELSCIYPDVFLMLPALLRMAGVSVKTAYFTMHVLVNVATFLIMYFAARSVTKNRIGALVAAVLFACAPQRMYIMLRGGQTYGMGLAILFYPLIITGMYHIFWGDRRKWYQLALGVFGITATHVLSTGLGMILCVALVVIMVIDNWARQRAVLCKETVVGLLKAAGATIVITLFVTVPFVYYYSTGININEMELPFIMSIGTLKDNFLSFRGIYHELAAVLFVALFVYRKKHCAVPKDEYQSFENILFAITLITFWLSTNLFPWRPIYEVPFLAKLLDMFQFAERFQLVTGPALPLAFGMMISRMKMGITAKRLSYIAITVICLVGFTNGAIEATANGVFSPDGVVAPLHYLQEGYLPKGTETSFYSSTALKCNNMDAITMVSYVKDGTKSDYSYTCSEDGVYVEFAQFYYPGYVAYDGEGNLLEIFKSDNNRVSVYLEKTEEPKLIHIEFTELPLFKVCAAMSLIGMALMAMWILMIEPMRGRSE